MWPTRSRLWRRTLPPRTLARAKPLSECALTICENALGPDHHLTNRCRSNCARLHLVSERPAEAHALGERALAAHEKALGPPPHAWTKDFLRFEICAELRADRAPF